MDLVQYFSKKATQYTLPIGLQLYQKAYVGTELKSFAVSWASKKFHHFLNGKTFQLDTEQRPPGNVLGKSLTPATLRPQHLIIRTLPYDFDVMYIKSPTNQLEDCLSRLGPLQDEFYLLSKFIEYHLGYKPQPAEFN